jgi:arylsulfatase A-like enzyme
LIENVTERWSINIVSLLCKNNLRCRGIRILQIALRSKILLLLFIALLGLAEAQTGGRQQRPRGATVKPNYLIIAIDDLNDWIGSLGGHSQVKTPNIDRLAARGTLFTNAHTQAPLCNPSRASLLTGLRPSTTGVYALQPRLRQASTLKDAVTLPQYLKRHGYRTLGVGKIFHDNLSESDLAREFDVWGEVEHYKNMPGRKFVTTPDPIRLMDWGPFPEKDSDHDDWKVADWAIKQLKSDIPRPFFLAVGLRLPHVPLYAPQKWFDLYPEDKLVLPPVKEGDRDDVPEFAWYLHWKLPEPRLSWLRANDQWRPMVRGYLATISFMDHQVGRLLDALESNGLAGNTVVVLWSDHGWHLGEKGISGKNTLWERSTRVPLIFAGPGVAGGARCLRPVELLDLYPTLLELSWLPASAALEGHSLVPLLKNPGSKRVWPAITTHNRNNHSVRSERWRYIRYADGSEELYNEARDPHEWTNLARDPRYAKVMAEHRRWLPRVNAPPVPGSAARLLTNAGGIWMWEGKPIRKDDHEP